MMRVIFVSLAYLCASVVCQDYRAVENFDVQATNRPSMLSMLSKFIEYNGTIDEIVKGSMTESYGGGVWLNATQRPGGICEVEERYIEEVAIVDKTPYQVEVEVWCWSIRCTEWETRYREDVRKQNVTKTRKVPQCCENYEMDPETRECRPICLTPCENNGVCVAPSVCLCEYGYEGKHCEIDSLPEGILSGPNVCEREEKREEIVRVVEQELVETSVKEWCWPKIRCTKTKMEAMPVEKVQKMIKPHRMRYCCDGFAQNFMGNRCFPVQYEEDDQQQIIQ